MTATRLFLTAAAVMLSSAAAFNTIQPRMIATRTQTNNKSSVASFMSSSNNNNDNEHENHFTSKPIVSTLTALSIFATLSTTPLLLPNTNSIANAYEESDYASETVTTVVQRLKSSTGSIDDTFLALEDVAKIITEGKGVGGQLTYDGVKLNEGYVADEDTTIYNPGLSLLTESEKERLTDAIIQNRKISLSSNQWNENNEYAFSFLKQKLDPLHMNELGGYLKILPFWGAALYLGALFVQQNSRGIFPLVYGLCALGVFGPVIVLVASGP
jgi:hypothetical protein